MSHRPGKTCLCKALSHSPKAPMKNKRVSPGTLERCPFGRTRCTCMIEKKSAHRHSESKNSAEKKGRAAALAEMHACNIRETFDSMVDTLNRALGSNITLTVHTAPGLPEVNADPHMLETLLYNLAVNAKEAMPGGGELNLSAQVSEQDSDEAAQHANARPGRFVRLAVADTGCGISAETLPHIFDTSFTTKSSGQKSGLGLAAVRKIVKVHKGWIETHSELGKGTVFRIYLPALETAKPAKKQRAAETPTSPPAVEPQRSGETILIVEDDPDLRDLVTQLLETRG